MPIIASAKKRMRQTKKRTMRNRKRKEHLKKAVKGYNTVLAQGDQAAADAELKKVHKAVDKAGDKGILHKNAVNRKKSRLARALNRAKQAS